MTKLLFILFLIPLTFFNPKNKVITQSNIKKIEKKVVIPDDYYRYKAMRKIHRSGPVT